MRHQIIRRLYDRCGTGSSYWLVMAAAQGAASVVVASTTIVLLSTFYDPPVWKVVVVVLVEVVLTATAVAVATSKTRSRLAEFRAWRLIPDPTPAQTAEVWEMVVNGSWRTYTRYSGRILLVVVIPVVGLSSWWWGSGWVGAGAALLATVIPAVYGTAVSYSISELLSRPMAEEIAARMPETPVYQPGALSVAKRLKIALPAYTTTAAMVTVTLLGGGHGAGALIRATIVAILVGIALSTELTVLLGDSITGPVVRMQRQLERIRGGDFTARTPVLMSDEFGELANDVNEMARGLEEREQIRTAFGTYMDRSVVDLILSGAVPPEGVEVTVSILFCDVRGFTSYAERASASEVIATLNEVFAAIVPIVERHGGHVDKFLGDGLLAVFGTPRPLTDHADRALEAACEIVRAVQAGPTGLRVGAGVNTGNVVAGPLGGAGRLNFSVIGDAVNVAARVEAATRQTGDDVLLTEATRRALLRPHPMESRGAIELKGKSEPLELFAVQPSPVGVLPDPRR